MSIDFRLNDAIHLHLVQGDVMRFFFFFAFALSLYSYTDEELESLWCSISDLKNPTLNDYRLIETYLQYGKRPYLDHLLESSWDNVGDELKVRLNIMRAFKLVGPNGEMPIFEKHVLNPSPKTKDRCILIYGSYNNSYPQSIYQILEELKEQGYSGTVMIRIGGYPNLAEGGLKSSPFFGRWKTEFFKEALGMGYKKIIHFDSHVHPLSDLSFIFQIMEKNGVFCLGHGPWLNVNKNFIQFAGYLNIPLSQVEKVNFISGYVLGLNFSDPQIVRFFNEWEEKMRNIDNFYCVGLDEMTFMALACKYQLATTPPTNVYSSGDFPPDMSLPSNRSFHFFFDYHRTQIRNGWAPLYD